jgi:hypothetical protein
MMRRPGIVTISESATIPDQRCTTSLRRALHRIRETGHKCIDKSLIVGSAPDNGFAGSHS